MRKLLVRCCTNNMVFEIDRDSLDAKTCGSYDPYCYKDPKSDAEYIEYTDWVKMRNEQWDKQEWDYYTKGRVPWPGPRPY
jgi:hypothetical protein